MRMRRAVFGVDVEQDAPPYFSTWRGIEEGMPLLMSLLEAHAIRATMFVTGQTASRFPEVIAAASRQHEIGCHGFDHQRFDRLNVEEQRRQVAEATEVLRRVTGIQPVGFRAPNFRYTIDTLQIVRAAGYRYDASCALYHRSPPGAPTELRRVANTFPSSVLRLPEKLSRLALHSAVALLPLVVLDFHPWELVKMSQVRPDIRFATGGTAFTRLDAALSYLKSCDVEFVTMGEAALGGERR